jgi:hypothetical protein
MVAFLKLNSSNRFSPRLVGGSNRWVGIIEVTLELTPCLLPIE